MRPLTSPHSRLLLCASAAHCAQVLHAAVAARVHLHGLQPCTQWPADAPAHSVLLWALLPYSAPTSPEAAREQAWRAQALQAGSFAGSIHMLYGNAAQQAAQLAPWVQHLDDASLSTRTGTSTEAVTADCWECLDAASEQKLFQHLLQRA